VYRFGKFIWEHLFSEKSKKKYIKNPLMHHNVHQQHHGKPPTATRPESWRTEPKNKKAGPNNV
jgi:hypothetical protein